MPPARQAPKPSPASIPAVFVIAAVVAVGSVVFGYPGLLALPVGVIVAAFIAPPAELTGKKDASGFPTAASPGETRAMNRYRMWGDLKTKALLPSADWMPGKGVRLWWIVSLLLAGVAACIPTTAVGDSGRALNALGVFMLINAVNGALRRWTAPDDPCPGPTVKDVITALHGSSKKIVIALVGAGILFVAVFIAGLLALNLPITAPFVHPVPPIFPSLGLALTIAVSIVTAAIRGDALAHWRTMVSVRAEWEPRWDMVKIEHKPRLLNHEQVGTIAIDTFEAHPTIGFAGVLGIFPKLGAAMGTAQKLALLECPSTDSQGQPIEGTIHPRQFRILTFDTDAMPNVIDPDTPQEQIDLRIAAAASWVSDGDGSGRWVFGRAEPLHTPDSETAAWFVEFYTPNGPDYEWYRLNDMGNLSGQVGAEVLMSHRDANRAIYIGDLSSGNTSWADESIPQELRNLLTEDEWSQRWKNALKMDAVRPRPEHGVYQEAKLGAIALYRQPFVVQQGLDPSEYFKLEPKLATTLSAAPFVSVTGFTNAAARREGERHVQAFSVTWCDPMKALPQNPDQLRPEDGNGPLWLLQGRMNEAFDAAKLPRPEVYAVRPLTEARSRGHIWEMKLRLYRGVTLGDVRSAAQRIRQHLNSDWLRVAEASDGIVIVAGSDPHNTRGLVYAGAGSARPDDGRPGRPGMEDRPGGRPARGRRPGGAGSEPDPELEKRNRDYITALDWEQAFYNAKVIGVAGDLPKLTGTATLPNNEAVAVLDFKLPAGTSRGNVREAVPVLMAATGNSFVEPRESPLGADYARLLVSRDHPLPDRAGFKWDIIDESQGIPFASGIEGEPIVFDPVDNPHVLLAGVTGSGKSVMAQAFIYGALVRQADLYVIDPVKGGADFNFAKGHAKAFASTPFEAAAVMKCVYAEVIRRKNINAAAGVGSFLDLAEPYNRIFVMIDEFTSLMGQDPVPPASDDPEAEAERDLVIASNRAKVEVGVYAGKIAREARSAGVHLMLGTQKLTAKLLDTLPGANDLKTNLARTLLGKTSSGDRASALRAFQDAPDLGGEIPKGRGLYEPLTSSAIAIQVWYASQDELHAELVKRRPLLDEADKADLAPYLPKVAGATHDAPQRREPAPLPPKEVKVAEVSFTIDALNAAAGVTPADAPAPDTTEEPMTTELGWLFNQDTDPAPQPGPVAEEPAPEIVAAPVGPMQHAYEDDDDIVEAAPGTPLTPMPARYPAEPDPVPMAVTVVEPAPETVQPAVPAAPARPLLVVDPAVPLNPALSAIGDVFILPARQSTESEAFGWWKLHPVIKAIYAAPGTTTVIWIDPDLAHIAPTGQQYAHVVHAALASIGITVHLAVDPAQLFGGAPATQPAVAQQAPAPAPAVPAAAPARPSAPAPANGEDDFMVQPPTRATVFDDMF